MDPQRDGRGLKGNVKCPSCGFVSFPDIPQCKKCGFRFVAKPDQRPSATDHPLESDSRVPPFEDKARPSPPRTRLSPKPAESLAPPAIAMPRSSETAGSSTQSSLEFERQTNEDSLLDASLDSGDAPGPGKVLDLTFGQQAETAAIGSMPLGKLEQSAEPGGDVAKVPEPRSSRAREDQDRTRRPIYKSQLITAWDSVPRDYRSELQSAPLRLRFRAGVLDVIALLAAAALFVVIFWIAGGHFTTAPLGLAVGALLVALLVGVYFGLFTSIPAATPGQSSMGLAVRNFDDGPPTQSQAWLRAFGYLVSIASFFLGFFWSLMDGDGLTWHDRISETYLASVERDPLSK